MKRLVPASKAWRALPLAGSGFGLVAFVRDVDGEQSHRDDRLVAENAHSWTFPPGKRPHDDLIVLRRGVKLEVR